jgi:L-cysteine/cystine lyase
VLIDAAQSVGVLPLQLDQLQADFYAFTGHKWWCGPEGLGGLYIRPEAMASLHPTFIGWRGITADVMGNQRDGNRTDSVMSWQPQPIHCMRDCGLRSRSITNGALRKLVISASKP